MERDTLSFRQVMALYWGGLLAPAAELLPGVSARYGVVGVWSVAAAGLAAGVGGWLFGRLAVGNEDAAHGVLVRAGERVGKGLLLLYILWGGLLVAVRLTSCARRLTGSGPQDGAAWFYLLVLAGMALWMGTGRLGRLGRAGELMLAALLMTGGIVLALGCGQARSINLLPRQDWSGSAMWPGIRVFGYGLLSGFLIRGKEVEDEGCGWIRWNLLGCGILGAAQVVLLGCFGGALTGRMDAPFFQLAKSVGIKGGFQRVESVVTAVWIFSDLLLLGYTLWVLGRLSEAVFPKASRNGVILVAAMLSVVVGFVALGERLSLSAAEELLLPVGGILLGIVIPVVLLGLKKKGNAGNYRGGIVG